MEPSILLYWTETGKAEDQTFLYGCFATELPYKVSEVYTLIHQHLAEWGQRNQDSEPEQPSESS